MIHGLATHDVLAAFLRAGDPGRGLGLAAWVPERPLVRLTRGGFLRPDALAVARAGEASIVIAIERDLGTEPGPVLAAKLERYRRVYDPSPARAQLHVGFVVDSARRGKSRGPGFESQRAHQIQFERPSLAPVADHRRDEPMGNQDDARDGARRLRPSSSTGGGPPAARPRRASRARRL